jgi:hypothetical protein
MGALPKRSAKRRKYAQLINPPSHVQSAAKKVADCHHFDYVSVAKISLQCGYDYSPCERRKNWCRACEAKRDAAMFECARCKEMKTANAYCVRFYKGRNRRSLDCKSCGCPTCASCEKQKKTTEDPALRRKYVDAVVRTQQ